MARLFTVPYFFVRSFTYTTSYRHGYLDFQRYRGGGRRGLYLRSFDTHARWHPVTQSARSRRSYGKMEDCEQSRVGVDLVSFLARPKPKIPFHGLSLLRNQTETLTTQTIDPRSRFSSKPSRLFFFFSDH